MSEPTGRFHEPGPTNHKNTVHWEAPTCQIQVWDVPSQATIPCQNVAVSTMQSLGPCTEIWAICMHHTILELATNCDSDWIIRDTDWERGVTTRRWVS
jgi:hypothetical protein